MSHQRNFDGPSALAMPLDFLSRFIRGLCLWPLVAAASTIVFAPFILWLVEEQEPDGARLIARVLSGFVICAWSPALAMAFAFNQRGQQRPWGSGGGGRPPDDPPDFPKPPEPSSPAVDIDGQADGDPASWVPDPEWFRQAAPTDLQEKEMHR